MAVPYQNLRSNTAGNTPASLIDGQIGINQADGRLYYRNSSGVVTQYGAALFAALAHSHGNLTNAGAIGSTADRLAVTTTGGVLTTATIGSGLSLSGGTLTASGGGSVPDPYELGTYPLITISAQPSAASVTAGNSATFSVTAAATLPTATIAYQWQVSTDSGSTWSAVSGATSSSLTLSSLTTSSNGYRYRCRLAANLSQIFSSSATLTVSSGLNQAVLLTSGTSYTVPNGATIMKAWAVGGGQGYAANFGGYGNAAGVAYKTWSVSGGVTVAYSVGSGGTTSAYSGAGTDSTVTFSGTTITGGGGKTQSTGGTFSGGDGGSAGGLAPGVVSFQGTYFASGGAIGGNGTRASCGRYPATDISGLLAAVALAGGKTTEDCGATAAFGSGAATVKYGISLAAGYGGGGSYMTGATTRNGGGGAVVLYFT